MMTSSRLSAFVSSALLFVSAHAAAPALPGTIFTTDQNGTVVNGNTHYLSKCGATGVYLDGGPGPNAPAQAASLADGDYYFQVTDASGKTLLSTDPVRNRCITVSGGLIVGTCPTGTHETHIDEDHGSSGARTVALCAAADVPFLNTPNNGGVYKVWATPAGDGTLEGGGFYGDESRVDNDCSAVPGCFHGFIASRSKTDSFKAQNSTTYCVRVDKEIATAGADNTPGAGWKILVTDSIGITSTYYTDEQGSTGDQICGLTAGSYTVEEEMQPGYTQIGLYLNGQPLGSTSLIVTLGSGNVTGDQTVLFVNEFTPEG